MSTPETVEKTVGGQVYRCTKLSARQQYHLQRKLAKSCARAAKAEADLRRPVKMIEALPMVAEDWGAMNQQEADAILDLCLSGFQRRQDINGQELWIPVANGAQLRFADIDGPALWELQAVAIEVNLANFTLAPLLAALGQPAPVKTEAAPTS